VYAALNTPHNANEISPVLRCPFFSRFAIDYASRCCVDDIALTRSFLTGEGRFFYRPKGETMKRRYRYQLHDVFNNVVYSAHDLGKTLKRLRESLVKPTIYSAQGRRHVVFYLENGEIRYLIGNFGESRKSVEERVIRLFRATDIARRTRRHV
jgi:hypothetical protein